MQLTGRFSAKIRLEWLFRHKHSKRPQKVELLFYSKWLILRRGILVVLYREQKYAACDIRPRDVCEIESGKDSNHNQVGDCRRKNLQRRRA